MLNIISRSIISKNIRGPRKVVSNLIRGLENLEYPFVINAALEATETIWIHDDPIALNEAMKLPSHIAIVAGPNIYTLPSDIPETIDTSRIVWIHPSSWVKNFWDKFGTKKITSEIWPVGIDTAKFTPQGNKKREIILIYNKQRSDTEIETVCRALDLHKEKYEVITYGKYQEAEYQNLLEKTKAIIWVGRSESQGIALLEALATNVPALIWDINNFGHWTGSGHEYFTNEQLFFSEATTAPYFSSQCGIRFSNKNELNPTLSKFLDELHNFQPRRYIEENFSLTKQARSFLCIYKKHFNVDDSSLKNSIITTKKIWRNDTKLFHILMIFKDAIRRIIR